MLEEKRFAKQKSGKFYYSYLLHTYTYFIRHNEPVSILNNFSTLENIQLKSDKLYVIEDNNNKCKEEVNKDLEIKEYFKSQPNKYNSEVLDNKKELEKEKKVVE